MKKNTCGYAGKIANVGSQRVEAPCAKAAPAPKGNVRQRPAYRHQRRHRQEEQVRPPDSQI